MADKEQVVVGVAGMRGKEHVVANAVHAGCSGDIAVGGYGCGQALREIRMATGPPENAT